MRSRGALLFLAASALARAGDSAAPAADTVSTARQDLATIRSITAPPDALSTLPSVDMKALSPGPGGGRFDATPRSILPDDEASLDPSKKKDKEKEGTGNWLVDAMDKGADKSKSNSAKDDALKRDLELLQGDKVGPKGELDLQAASESREKAETKEPATAVYNPLDAFMNGWVSARDHDLLLPAKADGLPGADSAKAHAIVDESQARQPEATLAETLTPIDSAVFADSKTDPNPYIAAIVQESAAPSKGFALPEIPEFSPLGDKGSPASFGAPQGPMDLSRALIPDFAQPSDDDKYFKQMKKF